MQLIYGSLFVWITVLAFGEGRVHVPGVIKSEAESQFNQGCRIRISFDLGEPQPLILNPVTNDFLYPTPDSIGILQLNTNQHIDLFCSTGFSFPSTTTNRLSAYCDSGTNVIMNFQVTNFTQVVCRQYPIHEARRTSERCANGAGIKIEVGFDIRSRFLSYMDLCHDEVIETSIYSHVSMRSINFGFQSRFPRPPFSWHGFYNGKNMNTIYGNTNQLAMFTRILGSAELAAQYIHPTTTEKFLARGHLTAKVDVIYGSQQRGTFWLMNATPQYQAFNGGNWESVESSTRRFFRDRRILNGESYTGTFGIMTLPDVNNVQQQIFLHFDHNNNGQIPAPAIYYKVLLDNDTRRGIALIGLNNIFLTLAEARNYVFCNDISGQINWITWDRHNTTLGYMYACTVDELARVVGHLPNLDVSGGLLI